MKGREINTTNTLEYVRVQPSKNRQRAVRE